MKKKQIHCDATEHQYHAVEVSSTGPLYNSQSVAIQQPSTMFYTRQYWLYCIKCGKVLNLNQIL